MTNAFAAGWMLGEALWGNDEESQDRKYIEKLEDRIWQIESNKEVNDWNDSIFKQECKAIKERFYERHPNLNIDSKNFTLEHPRTAKSLTTLERLSEKNEITPIAYIHLLTDILNF